MTEKYTPANGDPVDMSQVTLGPRYSSEDMYQPPSIVPGAAVSFVKDGLVYTDTVDSVSYSGGSPAIYRELNRWQSFLRRLTPPRWRRTLLVRAAEPAAVTVKTTPKTDIRAVFDRVLAQCDDALDRMKD